MIIRGTTPYHSFILPLSSSQVSNFYITYTQNGKKYKIYATIPSGSSYVYYYVSLNSGPEMSVKVGGSWKTGTPYVKVGGVWKQADAVYVKVNGVWKQST